MQFDPDRLPQGLLSEIIERAPAIVFIKDVEGRYLLVNRSFELMVGIEGERVVGKTDEELFSREEAERFRGGDLLAIEASGPVELMESVTVAGTRRDYLSVKFPLHGTDGKICATCGVTIDVTERGRVEETLKRSNSLLVATLESTADGILVVDRGGSTVRFNERLLDLWHTTRDELLKQEHVLGSHLFLSLLEQPEEFRSRIQQLEGASERTSTETLTTRDGTMLELYSQPQLLSGAVVGRVWSFRDVTSRVQAERHRDRLLDEERRARTAAEEAVHLRDEFLDVAAHELRTPMTSLKLTIQSLQKRLVSNLEPERARTMIDLAVRQAGRLEVLVDMLLDATHLHQAKLDLDRREVNLREICNDVVTQLGDDITRSGSTVTIHGSRSLVGYWDAYRLEQIVTNLLSNALKFGKGNPIDIVLDNNGRFASLRIHDSGVGISAGLRSSLFQRFVRGVTSRHYGGLGVGLYITRNLIEAHGGTIEVTSELGVGSSFIVKLPFRATAGTSSSASPASSPTPSSRSTSA